MKLRQIAVRRLPGLERGFEIASIAPGLSVIVGPNASGKSSLCRAVHATLWPNAAELDGTDLVTLWTDEGEEVLRAVLQGAARWQREGVDAEPPDVPEAALAHCYRLGVCDLLDAGSAAGAALAERIRVEMSGGYDFHAARRALARLDSDGRSEARALEAAQRQQGKTEAEQRTLGREEDQLARLQEELEEIATARRELLELDAAVRIATERSALEDVERELADFPESMDRLTGDEWQRLEEIEGDLARARDERERNQRDLEAALAEREACRFTDHPVAAPELDAMLVRARALLAIEAKRDQATSDLEMATAAAMTAARALGIEAGRDLDHIAGADLDELDAWVTDAFALGEERRRIGALRAELDADPQASAESPPTPPQPDADRIRKGLGWLRDWLAASGARPESNPWQRFGIGAGIAAGVALGAFVHWGFLILSALVLGMLCQAWRANQAIAIRRDHARSEFEALSLEAPAHWDRSAAAQCLNRLEQRLAERVRQEFRDREREDTLRRLAALEPREEALALRRQALLDRIGVDAGITDLHVADLLGRIRDWRSAHRRREETAAALAAIERERSEILERLRAFLSRHAANPIEDAAGAEVALGDLKTRSANWRNAEDRRAGCEREAARWEREGAAFAARREALLRNAAIDPGDPEAAHRELAARLERLAEWREAIRRRTALEQSLDAARRDLGQAEELLSLDAVALETRRRDARARLESHDRITGEIEVIQYRTQEASRGDVLEAARARVDAARDALSARREEFLDAETCGFFLTEVEAAYERETRPAVLRRAMALFSAFTRGHFALKADLSEGSGEFRALDTASRQGLRLDQLSDGTRMQLWLATRLAFAEHAETGPMLPLFLDEALTACDPERFRAVAACVFEMVRAGRQVFYLTADPSDVATWRQVATECGEPEPTVIDLAEVRGLAASAAPRGTAARLPQVPAPDGCSAADYAERIHVPPLDPFEPLDSVHLFHPLCGDLDLLHRLLDTARVDRIGHYRAQLESGAAELLLSADERQRIEIQIDLVDAFIGCWRIGRGRPVDRSVLEASQAVTKTFLDRITDLCTELGGDARRLIEAIEARADERVKGFRKASVTELRAYLEECGHLKADEPLSPGEICSRVVSSVAGHIQAGRIAGEDAAKRVQELASQLAGSPA